MFVAMLGGKRVACLPERLHLDHRESRGSTRGPLSLGHQAQVLYATGSRQILAVKVSAADGVPK